MKLSTLLLLFAAIVSRLAGQITLTDDFSTASNWSTGFTDAGTLAISGGRAAYSTSSTGDHGAALMFNAATFSSTSNWEARVDIHAALASTLTSPSGYFYASLFAIRTGDTIDFDAPPNLFSADIVRNGSSENIFQRAWWLNGDTEFEGGGTANISTTDAALRLTFDGTTKVLTAFYDSNGATGGYTWTSLGGIDIDGAQNWGLSGSDTFTLGLVVFAGGKAINASQAYFDNFSATAAVPEPSTYAALAGLAALGLVVWRRHRRIGRRERALIG